MKRLVVYNHNYHLRRLAEDDFDTYLKINLNEPMKYTGVQLPILESVPMLQRFWIRLKCQAQARKLVYRHTDIVIFGMQECLSRYIYQLAMKLGKSVRIVPDNIEFFLRPGFTKSSFSVKRLLKVLSLGLSLNRWDYDYLFFCNRLLLRIPDASSVDFDLSCFNVERSTTNSASGVNKSSVFISQPYYLDYGLDVSDWSASILALLNSIKGSVSIRYHQRDLPCYKEKLEVIAVEAGIQPDRVVYVGLFSTYMIQLALQGEEVYSHYDSVKRFFPSEYNAFVQRFAESLQLDLTGQTPWELTQNDLKNLFRLGF